MALNCFYVIKSFADKNTKKLWDTGKSQGMPPANQRNAAKRKLQLKNESYAGWAVHPGEILREEFLVPMGITPHKLSVDLRVSAPTVNDIVREKRGITPEMAVLLARYFGTSEQFWLNLQNAYAIYHAKAHLSRKLRTIKPVGLGAAAGN